MNRLPDTHIDVMFIDKRAGGHVPLYYGKGGGRAPMASVDAGDSRGLYVGGGGINRAFAAALKPQDCDRYRVRHRELLQRFEAEGADSASYGDDDPTRFSLLYAEHPVTRRKGWHDGICYVDVFGERLCPQGNPNNAAMLYAAPPCGDNYDDAHAFLAAVRATAGNIATAIGRYNGQAPALGLPAIEVLRLCLYSSGIYNTLKVDVNAIARSIYDGLHEVLKGDACGLGALELPCGTDAADPLFASVRQQLSGG